MNLQENIDRMKLELADMEKQLQAEKQIELQGGEWYMRYSGAVDSTSMQSDCTDNGLERATKELAIEMRDRIVTSSQIEARGREIDPDWVADWSYSSQKKYCICLQNNNRNYVIGCSMSVQYIGAPYMSYKTAIQICKELNEGRFVLGYKD